MSMDAELNALPCETKENRILVGYISFIEDKYLICTVCIIEQDDTVPSIVIGLSNSKQFN